MRPLGKGFLCAACCALAFGLSATVVAQSGEPAAPRDPQTVVAKQTPASAAVLASSMSPSSAGQIAAAELPDSPGAAWSREQDPAPQTQSNSPQTATPPSGQTDASQPTPAQDQGQRPQRPVGTAAAEAPKVKGVTAAEPAGVAIAPAKQRRVRTIVLRMGAILGAGAAVGTVVALTAGTPSRPPGAH